MLGVEREHGCSWNKIPGKGEEGLVRNKAETGDSEGPRLLWTCPESDGLPTETSKNNNNSIKTLVSK